MEQSPIEWIEQEILKGELSLLEIIKRAKELEAEQAEKLKDFDYWKEWKNKSE